MRDLRRHIFNAFASAHFSFSRESVHVSQKRKLKIDRLTRDGNDNITI